MLIILVFSYSCSCKTIFSKITYSSFTIDSYLLTLDTCPIISNWFSKLDSNSSASRSSLIVGNTKPFFIYPLILSLIFYFKLLFYFRFSYNYCLSLPFSYDKEMHYFLLSFNFYKFSLQHWHSN